jgi:hypothetical protein
MMIARRRLILSAGAFLCAPPVRAAVPYVVPPGDALSFQVIREGSVIGAHTLNFDRSDPYGLVVRVSVDLSVGIGPIKLFRYKHRATETWKNGQVVSVVSETDDNGKHVWVRALRDSAGLVVEASETARYVAPDDALPATHWNRKMLDGPLINTQTGQLMRPHVTHEGEDRIPTAEGREIEADHFAMNGDASLDTWYDTASIWAGIMFKAADGSQVRYERV